MHEMGLLGSENNCLTGDIKNLKRFGGHGLIFCLIFREHKLIILHVPLYPFQVSDLCHAKALAKRS